MTIIAEAAFLNLKEKIEAQAILPATYTLRLSHSQHRIETKNQQFTLNFNDKHHQSLRQTAHPLLKAIGKNPGKILDACAGLGKDGFILAHFFEVVSTENNLILYTLLEQAIQQYIHHTPINWKVHYTDCQEQLKTETFDTIYLDPMFTLSRSAKPKLPMQMIQALSDDTPFSDWLSLYQAAKKRLVIKTHQRLPAPASLPMPSMTLNSGRNIRYYIYLKP